MKKKLFSIVNKLAILFFALIFFTGCSGNCYPPDREVEQLSTDYYLGPVIDENKSYIYNVKHFETYDGLTEFASRIGYYIQFDYRKDEIDCEIFIHSYPFERYEGDFVNSNVYVYKGYEIYVHDILGGSISNIVSVVSMAHLGDYIMDINVSITNQDNYACYREISLEFMYELIDNYVANSN